MENSYISLSQLYIIEMVGYYDLVLGAIPTALLGITGVLLLSGYPATTAVPAGSVVALGLMGHAMFVNGPVDRSTTEETREVDSPGNAGVAPPNAD